MTGKKLNAIYKVGAVHALYRENGIWYHSLRRFPGALFDGRGYVLFESERQYLACQEIKHGPDENTIHIYSGIEGIAGYVPLDPPPSTMGQ